MPINALIMPESQSSGHASFGELARLFDDEEIKHFTNAVLGEDDTEQPRSSGFASATGASSSASNREQYPFASLQDKPQLHQQKPSSSAEFVSAYVVIDPTQPDRILVPHQLLTYSPPGSAEPLSVTWGPVVLPSSILMGTPAFPSSKPIFQPQQQQQQHPPPPQKPRPRTLQASPNKKNQEFLGAGRVQGLPKPVPYPTATERASNERSVPSPKPAPRRRNSKAKQPPRSSTSLGGDDSEDDGGKPRLLKPLTAYNFYYRDERDNIVFASGNEVPPPVSDFSEAKRQRLLQDRWVRDPVKGKRVHRKTHGKMEFTK